VQLGLNRNQTEENKFLFDQLYEQKTEIEQQFGHPLEWLRLDDKKSSRIQFTFRADSYNKDEWPTLVTWHLEHMSKLEKAMKLPLQKAVDALRNGISS
jgi:hypothetical protein